MHLKYISRCRVCNNEKLVPVLDLGEQYLQGAFAANGKAPPLRKIPTKFVRCDVSAMTEACGLVQSAVSVPPQILYSNYWYQSHISGVMRAWLAELAAKASHLEVERGVIVDIGGNSGEFVRHFKGRRRVIIDPSDVAKNGQDPRVEVINTTFPCEMNQFFGRCSLVTSFACYYDVDDPVTFAMEVANLLSFNGIWMIEVAYLPTVLANLDYPQFCHEHVSTFSLAVLENIFSVAGLEVLAAEKTETNGGSLLLVVGKKGSNEVLKEANLNQIQKLREEEFALALDTPSPYDVFQIRFDLHSSNLRNYLTDLAFNKKKTIHLYGASTKANVAIQAIGLDNKIIACASDRDERKWGGHTVGTGIPIVSEEASRKMNPDYYLSYIGFFRKEIVKRESSFLEGGGKFIWPLPQIMIEDKSQCDYL